MTHPIELSTRIIDTGTADEPVNRFTQELSELADDIAIIESFSHATALKTDDGLVVFDASGPASGRAVVDSLRGWSNDPIHTLVYTHGHLDHVGGSRAFAADAQERGHLTPRVLGHSNVNRRLDRYDDTNGYNVMVNLRQFGGLAPTSGDAPTERFVPDGTLRVGVDYDDRLIETIGGLELHHHHALGETDDHTWTWVPRHRMIAAGDQFIWYFPNCGNPQKVQRYPKEWAESLRAMVAMEPELFVPAHGLPIAGADRIALCLETVADTLEKLVADVLDAMNSGASLDTILHEVEVDAARLELPFLLPLYDEPEFAIRNIWRLYGGWWDGDPSELKPAPKAVVARELADLIGGVVAMIDRAVALSAAGDHRMACHLIEIARRAEPEDEATHEARATIYAARRRAESSLMSKGIFAAAEAESDAALGKEPKRRGGNLLWG